MPRLRLLTSFEGSTANEFFKLSPEEAREELDIAVREIEEEMTSWKK